MPLDNADFIPKEYQDLLRLARKLRGGDFSFTWDYTGCGSCAIELGKAMFGADSWANCFGLSNGEFRQVFINAGRMSDKRMQDVQPEDVADVIEQIVEAKVYA